MRESPWIFLTGVGVLLLSGCGSEGYLLDADETSAETHVSLSLGDGVSDGFVEGTTIVLLAAVQGTKSSVDYSFAWQKSLSNAGPWNDLEHLGTALVLTQVVEARDEAYYRVVVSWTTSSGRTRRLVSSALFVDIEAAEPIDDSCVDCVDPEPVARDRGELKYDFSFEDVDFQPSCAGASNCLPCSGNCPSLTTDVAREGRHAMMSYVNCETSDTPFRTEMSIPGSRYEKGFALELDHFVGFSIYIPEDWRHTNLNELVAQIHSNDAVPFSITIGTGDWIVKTRGAGRTSLEVPLYAAHDTVRSKDDDIGSAYDDRGRWVDFVLHYRPAYTSTDGHFELFKDGVSVVRHTMSNAFNDRDADGRYYPHYWKMGMYLSWKLPERCGRRDIYDRTIYHDALRIAVGPGRYDDVAPW